MPEIYRQHDLLLFPSEWEEPFALTPIEAMACGLPVIGTTTGGSAELFRDRENALTFSAGKPEELAERIWEFASDHRLRARCTEIGCREARARYSTPDRGTDRAVSGGDDRALAPFAVADYRAHRLLRLDPCAFLPSTLYVPYPMDRGADHRGFHLLRELARGHDVDLLALSEDGDGPNSKTCSPSSADRVEMVPLIIRPGRGFQSACSIHCPRRWLTGRCREQPWLLSECSPPSITMPFTFSTLSWRRTWLVTRRLWWLIALVSTCSTSSWNGAGCGSA